MPEKILFEKIGYGDNASIKGFFKQLPDDLIKEFDVRVRGDSREQDFFYLLSESFFGLIFLFKIVWRIGYFRAILIWSAIYYILISINIINIKEWANIYLAFDFGFLTWAFFFIYNERMERLVSIYQKKRGVRLLTDDDGRLITDDYVDINLLSDDFKFSHSKNFKRGKSNVIVEGDEHTRVYNLSRENVRMYTKFMLILDNLLFLFCLNLIILVIPILIMVLILKIYEELAF